VILSMVQKAVGMFTNLSTDNIGWTIEKGFRFNTVGSADLFLMQGARTALEKARKVAIQLQSQG